MTLTAAIKANAEARGKLTASMDALTLTLDTWADQMLTRLDAENPAPPF